MKHLVWSLGLMLITSTAYAQKTNGQDIFFSLQCKTPSGTLKLWTELQGTRCSSWPKNQVEYTSIIQSNSNSVGPYFEAKGFTGLGGTYIRAFLSNRRRIGLEFNTSITKLSPGSILDGTIILTTHSIFNEPTTGMCSGRVLDPKTVKTTVQTSDCGE